MPLVVLDTDVASRVLRQTATPAIERALVGRSIAITFVTLAELLVWAEARSWGIRRRNELDAWLAEVVVLPYNRRAAAAWAHLTVGTRKRGRPRSANDTWIAACCLASSVPLATLNRRDYEDFERYDGLVLLP